MTDQDEWDAALQQIRGIMGEHFHSWGFVVLDEAGDMSYDYTNCIIGEMLFDRAIKDMNSEFEIWGIDMDIDEEEDDYDA